MKKQDVLTFISCDKNDFNLEVIKKGSHYRVTFYKLDDNASRSVIVLESLCNAEYNTKTNQLDIYKPFTRIKL